ncbi:MAG: helix-turn-helix transcriptional regulator [Oscillospiraceae bacterium]|nr:helix-turn-helix transcriptional regulator [Oscillospiraceae bacterium]
MILAEKIMQLRKKNGWSQEDLAEQLNVSRQSVSKWESAQSIPDLNKILAMSRLFDVSTDYLLKDDAEEEIKEPIMDSIPINSDARFVSIEEANRFLNAKEITAPRVAIGTSLCILSPIPLMFLGALTEITDKNGRSLWITENVAGGLGLILLAIMVAAAVALFLSCRSYTADFDYLDKEPIETAYGVTGMVQELKADYRDTYNRNNLIAACMGILSTLPFFGALLFEEEGIMMITGLCLMLAIIAVAVNRFVAVGVIWESYQKLLQEGDYSRIRKQNNKSVFHQTYWPLVTAIYLLISFTTGAWHLTWLIWLIASPVKNMILSLMKK